MMESLCNKKILIGRESETSRLKIAVPGYGSVAIGPAGAMPKSVSRCRPEDSIAHASIAIDHMGNMVLVNLKEQNETYVDRMLVASKHIDPSSTIQLGRDRAEVPLSAVLNSAIKLVKPQIVPKPKPTPVPPGPIDPKPAPGQPVDMSRISAIWDEYQDTLRDIQAKQRRLNLIRSLQGVVVLGSGMLTALLDGNRLIGVIGLGLAALSFIFTYRDNSYERREKATRDLHSRYLCPHCHKSLPVQPYYWLKRNYAGCQYCKSKFKYS